MTGAKSPISISVAPTTRAIGKRYYDLPGTIELMHRLWQEAVVDGFEFQNLAEWDASGPPRDEASVENAPTHLARSTPFDLVQPSEWITLDLRWVAMYDELDRFESVMDRVVNVHLRGCLEGRTWQLDDAPFGFYEALRILRQEWRYCGPLTTEPSGLREGEWEGLVAAMASLKGAG